MAFIPENLKKLNEVSGLTREMVPESGLVIESAWLPVIVSASLAAASPRGAVTYGPTGTGEARGRTFTGTFESACGGSDDRESRSGLMHSTSAKSRSLSVTTIQALV